MTNDSKREYIAWIKGTEREARCFIAKGGAYVFTPEAAHRFKGAGAAKAATTRAHKAYPPGHTLQESGFFCTSRIHLYTE